MNECLTLPAWLKRPLGVPGKTRSVDRIVEGHNLHTVCREASCPNRSECYSSGTATFLILGEICSRSCAFCGVGHGTPQSSDPGEPLRIVEAVAAMELSYVVLTMVTRDDLSDGGAGLCAQTVRMLHERFSNLGVEVLVSDFAGNDMALDLVLASKPDVFNHNIETVVRLYPAIRPTADYRRSLGILKRAAAAGLTVKSGIMVGLGETEMEVCAALSDLRQADVSIVTIGQYLRPSPEQIGVAEFITPEQFADYEEYGYAQGFSVVYSGPFVRSSYKAAQAFSMLRPA